MLSSIAMDGKEGHGLKGLDQLFQFLLNAMPANVPKKLLWLRLLISLKGHFLHG